MGRDSHMAAYPLFGRAEHVGGTVAEYAICCNGHRNRDALRSGDKTLQSCEPKYAADRALTAVGWSARKLDCNT
jgi:hypothetical protein